MKEFYIKNTKKETIFFFRNSKSSKLTYEEWKKKCDEIKIKENNTFKELLEFLKIKEENKIEFKLGSIKIKITIWKNRKYEIIEIKTKDETAIVENNIIYKINKKT